MATKELIELCKNDQIIKQNITDNTAPHFETLV